MAGVHCSFFIFVWVSLFVALIFSDPLLPLSAFTAVRRFFLPPCSPVVSSSLSALVFQHFATFLPTSLQVLLSFPFVPCSLRASLFLLPSQLFFPLWLALASGFFLFPSLPRLFLHPSSFLRFGAIFLSFILPVSFLALSVLRFHTPPPFGRDGR